MARPPSGPDLVEGIEGSPEAKERLKVILETIAGTKTIAQACEQLGIGEAAFHKLRTRHLEDAVAGLEPRKPGRKPNEACESDEVRSALQEKVKSLERQLQAARIREKVALIMPHLFTRGKKNEND